MAKRNNKPNDHLISLIDRAFSAEDAKEKYGMKIGDHKLICSVLDAHLSVTKSETDKQNNEFKNQLIANVIEVIRQELTPLNKQIKDLETDLYKKIAVLQDGVDELMIRNSKKAIRYRWIAAVVVSVIIIIILYAFFSPWWHLTHLHNGTLSMLWRAINF